MKANIRNGQGIAMVVVLMIMMILLAITGASLLFSELNLKTASNLKTGGGAIYAADAGVQHGLALLPAGTNFNSLLTGSVTGFPCASPCDGTTNHQPTLTGSLNGYTYSVVAQNDPNDSGGATNDTNNLITFTTTANGPNSSQRKIKAYIGRSTNSWAPPGAIYIPGPASDPDFQIHGSATITGNDYNVDGTPGPAAAVPGIATNSDATTQQVKNSITTPSNVTGAGGTTPNVATTTSPLDINALANSFLAQPHTNTCTGTTFGTFAAPQITYCSGQMQLENNTSGAGVLIVDGQLQIQDNFNFKGIIITRGGEVHIELSSTSSTNIYGAILISPAVPEIEIEGGGAIKYSSQAIQKVQDTWPGVLAQKARLIAWNEVMQ